MFLRLPGQSDLLGFPICSWCLAHSRRFWPTFDQESHRRSRWSSNVRRTTPLTCTTSWISPTPWRMTWKTSRVWGQIWWKGWVQWLQTSESVGMLGRWVAFTCTCLGRFHSWFSSVDLGDRRASFLLFLLKWNVRLCTLCLWAVQVIKYILFSPAAAALSHLTPSVPCWNAPLSSPSHSCAVVSSCASFCLLFPALAPPEV